MTAQSSKPLVRVTQIEAFRRWTMQSDHDLYEIPEQSVIDSITGTFTGNDLTRVGTAFHAIVQTGCLPCTPAPSGTRSFTRYGHAETEPVPEGRTFTIDGHNVTLDLAQIDTALAYRYSHRGAFHETRIYKDYGPAVVTGCADMIDGITLRDIKTRFSPPQDTPYYDSCQWRFYLDMFGADTFLFDIFTFRGYSAERHAADVRGLTLQAHTPPISVYAYAAMRQDLDLLLRQFLQWADMRGLMPALVKQKIK